MFHPFWFEDETMRLLREIQRRLIRIEHQLNIKDQDEHYCPTCGWKED